MQEMVRTNQKSSIKVRKLKEVLINGIIFLVEYYKWLLNSKQISAQKMFLDTEATLNILKIYTFEKEK